MYFEKIDANWPDFWSYLTGAHWRSTGSIQPQGLAVADLNRDGRDDLIFQFWQDLGYSNYGSFTSEKIPNRLLILLADEEGYVDVTNAYLSKEDQFIDGVSLHPTVADINGDGYPDLWMIANQEDGRRGDDLADMYGVPSMLVFNPESNKFIQTRPTEQAWWFYGGSYSINDKSFFWAAGTSQNGVFQTVNSSKDSAKSVGLAAVYSFDTKTNTILLEPGLPSGGSGPVLVPWANSDPTQNIVAAGYDANSSANFLGLWVRTVSGWDLADGTPTDHYVPFEYVAWNGTKGTINIDPESKLSTPAYLHPLTMRLDEDTNPLIVYIRKSFQVGQPSADGIYYESDLSTVRFLEFWSVEDEKLQKVNIKILNEVTSYNTEVSEIKDINLDGVDDWITYPYDTLGAPIVYLGTGGDVMVRVPEQVFPKQPSNWALRPDELTGVSRFIHADGDHLWDLLFYPGQSMPSEWSGDPLTNVYRTDVSASPLVYRGVLKDIGRAVKDDIQIQDRLGSKKIFTFSGNDSITDVNVAAGASSIDGGLGTDTVIYSGNLKDYDYVRSKSGDITVMFIGTGSEPKVNDTLINIERISFADSSVALDLDANAGLVAKTIGAVFGKEDVTNKAFVGIGLHFVDELNYSYPSLMELAINARLGANPTHDQVVDLLYTNVVGQAPDAATRKTFTDLLDNGSFTLGGLGVLAADTEFNKTHINLVGLAQTGLEYLPFGG